MADKSGWSQSQAKHFVREAKTSLGEGAWAILSPPLRSAVLAKECLAIILTQHAETVRIEDVRQLWEALRREAGVDQSDHVDT